MPTAAQRFQASLTDPGLKAQLQEEEYRHYRDATRVYQRVNPFAVSQEAAEYLETQGVGSMPNALTLHTHGADKALENEMLSRVSHRLNNLSPGPYTFFQLKPGKLGQFRVPYQLKTGEWKERGRARTDGDQFVNWFKEARDLSRFEGNRAVVFERLSGMRVLHNTAFMSDTLHFMQPLDLLWLFLSNPHLDDLLATVVLPVEACEVMPSLHPEVYTLEYFQKSDMFAYYPGGHAGSGYVHPMQTLQWLRIGVIEAPGLRLVVDKIETLGAHHLLHITRRPVDVPRLFTYAHEQYARVPQIFYPEHANARRPYPVKMLEQMHSYVHSIGVVALRNLHAKLRSIIPTKELHLYSAADKVCLANYFLYVGALNPQNDYEVAADKGLIGLVLARLRQSIRPTVEKWFGKSEYAQLLDLSQLEYVSFTTEPVACKFGLDWWKVGLGSVPPPTGPWPPRAPADWGFDNDTEASDTTSESNETVVFESEEEFAEAMASSTPPAPTAPIQDAVGDELRAAVELDIWADAPTAPPAELYTEAEKRILAGCGFTDLRSQHGPLPKSIAEKNGLPWDLTLRPIPALTLNATCPPACDMDGLPSSITTALKESAREPRSYKVDASRAGAFANSCKNRHIGLLLKKQTDDWLKSLDARAETSEFSCKLSVVHGAGGSGKSRSLQEAIRTDADAKRHYRVVVPTQELRQDWIEKLPFMRKNICTWERGMLEGGAEVVIFDDYGKLPSGYVDCWLATHTGTKLVVLTADARQSVYHCQNQQAAIAQISDEVTHFEKWCPYYLNCTHRLPRNFANALFVHAAREDMGGVQEVAAARTGVTVLVPSTASKDMLIDLGTAAHTYAGCQGLTRRDVALILDHNTPFCSEQVMYTALTRATHNIEFVNSWGEGEAAAQKRACTPYLMAILSHRQEYELDPRFELPEEPAPPEEPRVKTHLAPVNEDALVEDLVAELPDKYERELWDAKMGEHSNVFQTEDPLIQTMAHQQARDEVLFQKTMDARLVYATPEENAAELIAKRTLGDLLFEAYYKRMGLTGSSVPFEPDLYAECIAAVERTFMSKTVSQLQNGESRQDPDFDDDGIALFLKSQWVKKEEKLACPAKAGQTIASFKQEVVMRYGAAARYMRRLRERTAPENLFIMCEKTPGELAGFVRKEWKFDRLSYTSDYTQYDNSQDGAFLNFELRKMRYYSLPEDVIQGYQWIKTHAKVFSGPLGIMRLSGEGPTFDANTECNIAYDSLRFDIPADCASMYAGDDLARDKVCPERRTWRKLEPLFKLTAKPLATDKPDFCGWRIIPQGVVKSPKKLWAGLMLGVRRGRVHEVVRSYGLDYKFAFDLGDQLHDVFDEEDMEYHTATTRLLVRHGCSITTGEHTPAYHIRSDHLLGKLKETTEALLTDELSEEDDRILRILDEEGGARITRA